MSCDEEISLLLEKIEKDTSVFSPVPIDYYIECGKKQNLITKYFPIVDSGFLIYKDTTIFLTSEKEGTILSLNQMIY